MDIKELMYKINLENLKYNLYFTRKLKSGGYTSFAPNIDKQIFEDLTSLIVEYLQLFEEKDTENFNPTGIKDGVIEKCDYEYVGNYEEILESFSEADVVDTEINPDNFTFYCLEIYSEDPGSEFNLDST